MLQNGTVLALSQVTTRIERANLTPRAPLTKRGLPTMRRTPVHALMLVAAMAAALTGCSRLPTAPSSGAAAAPAIIGQVDDPIPPGAGGAGGFNSVTLAVGEGGSVQYGNFTLVIHKNSLKMPATIKIIQPDPNVLEAEFEVTPPAANDFQVPVRLVADCSNQPASVVKNETVYWWNGTWVESPKQNVTHNNYVLITGCKSLSNAKVDLKSGK
jgi:hypothetical protein